MNTVYLFGAGFTRAIIDSAPLNNDVLKRIDRPTDPKLIKAFEDSFPDVERFLTLVHLINFSSPASVELRSAYNDIYTQIANQFCIEKLNVKHNNSNGFRLLKQFIETIPACSHILTLNYDCVLDQGLWLTGAWSPFGGYVPEPVPTSSYDRNEYKRNIKLLKLHGSVNFRQSSSPLVDDGQEYFNIEISDHYFPGINSSINRRRNTSPYVVLMSYLKIYRNGVKMLWREAISALAKAERLIIIGCSLRREYLFLQFALYHFGMKNDASRFVVDIVDIEESICCNLKEKVKGLVANPDKVDIRCFSVGLAGYINDGRLI